MHVEGAAERRLGETALSRSRGSLVSSMLTLIWAPSGLAAGRLTEQSRGSEGAALTSTRLPCTVKSAPWMVPSRSIPSTSAPVRMRAPACTAASASASVTAPMPPTGTSQSPVPPPITW